MPCTVQYNGKKHTLCMQVVDVIGKPCLTGRDWLGVIQIDWKNVFMQVGKKPVGDLDVLLSKYERVFQDGYGGIKGFEAKLRVDKNAVPVYGKSRPVPYTLIDQVENELKKLEQNGVIEKVEQSEWASPLVVIPKNDNSVRLCGDYKVTVNKFITDEAYTLPTAQDLSVASAGATV